jgi:hypothetical protein
MSTKKKTAAKTPKKNSSHKGKRAVVVSERWAVRDDATGREIIVYSAPHPRPLSVLGAQARRAGHWDYDRCEVVGASDLGRVEVGQ